MPHDKKKTGDGKTSLNMLEIIGVTSIEIMVVITYYYRDNKSECTLKA